MFEFEEIINVHWKSFKLRSIFQSLPKSIHSQNCLITLSNFRKIMESGITMLQRLLRIVKFFARLWRNGFGIGVGILWLYCCFSCPFIPTCTYPKCTAFKAEPLKKISKYRKLEWHKRLLTDLDLPWNNKELVTAYLFRGNHYFLANACNILNTSNKWVTQRFNILKETIWENESSSMARTRMDIMG